MTAENPKARILHVIDHTNSGGTQAQIGARLEALQQKFSFSVAVLGNPGRYSQTYQAMGIPVHHLDPGGSRWGLGSFLPLLSLIRQEKPRLLHAHLFKAIIFAPVAAQLSGIPCLLHDHSGLDPVTLAFYFPDSVMRGLYTLAYRMALGLSARLLVMTPELGSAAIRNFHLAADKVVNIPNGIDLEHFEAAMSGNPSLRADLGLAGTVKLVMMVGRLAPEKDWNTFLEVARRFPDPNRFAFVAVGSGELADSLRQFSQQNHLRNIHFLGERRDIPWLLKQADAFLLTSRHEAFPNVLLEAMAAACPVIASRTAGSLSILQHGYNGLLVEPGDVEAFAISLETVLTDAKLADSLKHSARKTVNQFDQGKVDDRLEQVYRELIERKETGAHD